MMKKYYLFLVLFLFISFLGITSFFTAQKVFAGSKPKLEISDVKLEVGDTFVRVLYTAKNVPGGTSAQLIYNKPNDKVPFVKEDDYVDEGKNIIAADNLLTNTKYEYQLLVEDFKTSVKTFTTKNVDFMKIIKVAPTQAKPGTTITIEGMGFGTRAGKVRVGYCGWICNDTVVSWSDTKIVAKVGGTATNGPVKVFAYPAVGFRSAYYGKNVDGPEVVVNSGRAVYIIDGDKSYCGSPEVIAKTYNELLNVNNIYFDEYRRGAQCYELKFHIAKKTPHDRLRSWLKQQDESKWWQKIVKTYKDKTIYDFNTGLYLVTSEGLRKIPDFQTMVAWGITFDDAEYVADLYNPSGTRGERDTHYGVRSYGDNAFLRYSDGPYFEAIEAFIQGGGIDTGDETLDDYLKKHENLLKKIDPSESDDKEYKDICTTVSCGKKY